MSEQDHFLSTTPVDVAIKALQVQVEQLKRILNKTDEVSPVIEDNSQELKQEIKRLQTLNDKAEYRIKMLLRTLEEKEQK
ncbi:hypothetical protein INT47_013092 [Mucor saturninus]|uniref:Uncharacterized protein n=1 Tax=Mucor saturninus TaxID=64648 RepID=A0A8H7UXN4_9FUNG|nr:hypothetical protein INT47_013092 [Mucor saturninus]